MCTASAVFACSRVRTAPWLSRGASWHRRATAPQLLLVREARAQAAGGKLPPAAQRHTPGLRRASEAFGERDTLEIGRAPAPPPASGAARREAKSWAGGRWL